MYSFGHSGVSSATVERLRRWSIYDSLLTTAPVSSSSPLAKRRSTALGGCCRSSDYFDCHPDTMPGTDGVASLAREKSAVIPAASDANTSVGVLDSGAPAAGYSCGKILHTAAAVDLGKQPTQQSTAASSTPPPASTQLDPKPMQPHDAITVRNDYKLAKSSSTLQAEISNQYQQPSADCNPVSVSNSAYLPPQPKTAPSVLTHAARQPLPPNSKPLVHPSTSSPATATEAVSLGPGLMQPAGPGEYAGTFWLAASGEADGLFELIPVDKANSPQV